MVYAVVGGQKLTLDIAYPDNLTHSAPAIVDIPGGAWRTVRKSAEDAIWYAQQGFVGVSIIHRTSDIAVFPAAVHDCKTVVRWLRANAEKFNINPDEIGVTGFSFGGHLATLLGTSGGDRYLEGEEGYPEFSSRVQAVVDHFGPTDFLRMNDCQFQGRKTRISPHLVRAPQELVNKNLEIFYNRILGILQIPVFRNGYWQLLGCMQAWEGNRTHDHYISFLWHGKEGERIVGAVNYSPVRSQCYVRLPFNDLIDGAWLLKDLISDITFEREASDLKEKGMYLDEPGWKIYLFSLNKKQN